jgi:hypothetical protein
VERERDPVGGEMREAREREMEDEERKEKERNGVATVVTYFWVPAQKRKKYKYIVGRNWKIIIAVEGWSVRQMVRTID